MSQTKEYAELYREMEAFEERGIHMEVEERQVSAFGVVQAHMVKENGTYMRDYVWDSEGQIKKIIFNNIR